MIVEGARLDRAHAETQILPHLRKTLRKAQLDSHAAQSPSPSPSTADLLGSTDDAILYVGECGIPLLDALLEDMRLVCVSEDALLVTAPGGKTVVHAVPLLQIRGMRRTSRRHEALFFGGLPHLTIEFLVESKTKEPSVERIEIRTGRRTWQLPRLLQRAVVDANLRHVLGIKLTSDPRDSVDTEDLIRDIVAMPRCSALKSYGDLESHLADVGGMLVDLSRMAKASRSSKQSFWKSGLYERILDDVDTLMSSHVLRFISQHRRMLPAEPQTTPPHVTHHGKGRRLFPDGDDPYAVASPSLEDRIKAKLALVKQVPWAARDVFKEPLVVRLAPTGVPAVPARICYSSLVCVERCLHVLSVMLADSETVQERSCLLDAKSPYTFEDLVAVVMAATSLTLDPVRTSLESWPLAETLATPATAVGSLPARTTNADVERQLGRLHTRGITLLHHLIQFGLAHRDSRQTLDDLLVHYHNTTNLDGVMATSVSVLIRFCEAYGRVEYTRHIHPSRLAQVLATSPKLAHRHSCVSAGPHRPPAVRTSKGFWTTRPSRIPPSTIAGTYKACLVLTYLVDLCGTRRLQQTVDSLYGEELRYLFAPAALYAAPQSAGPCTQPSGHLFMCDQILAAVSRLHRLQLASTSTSTSTTLT